MNEDKILKKVLNIKTKWKIVGNKTGTTGCRRYHTEQGIKWEETVEVLRDDEAWLPENRQSGNVEVYFSLKISKCAKKKTHKTPVQKYTHPGSVTSHKEILTFVLRSWVSIRTDRTG